MMDRDQPHADELERLRQFKADFFKALAHPLRIGILEILLRGPLSVHQIQEVTGSPGSSVSQQLAILRARGIVATERRGTTNIYRVQYPELVELLDVARRVFYTHLSAAADLLRLVEDEAATDAGP